MKTKHILFTIALFFSVAFTQAQDKYEFAIITYYPTDGSITIAIDGKEMIKGKTEGTKEERYAGNPLLKVISEYQDKKWEIMSFNNLAAGTTSFSNTYVYLKKKKS